MVSGPSPNTLYRGLIGSFATHSVAANLLLISFLLFGAFAIYKLNREFFPEIVNNNITVSVKWPGASAEDVEKNILDILEPELRFIDNLDDMTSYAREGSATIRLSFATGTEMIKASEDVDRAVKSITRLPQDAGTPETNAPSWTDAVADITISGPFSESTLKKFALRMRDQLVARGIEKVGFTGLRNTEYLVEISPAKLRQLNLGVDEVARRIARNSRDLPAGTVQGEFERQVRTTVDIDRPEALADIVVKSRQSGEKITLADIATIREVYDDSQITGLVNGQPAIELTPQRSSGADTLETDAIVDEWLAEAQATFPASLNITKSLSRADLLNGRIMLLVENGLTGLVLVLIVLFVFLDARIAFWVACGIPVAIFATLGIMWSLGESINMISLFALIMMLGIIVDDAIVVGEHTATLHERGNPPHASAISGARAMIRPITAASLTTIAAFLPILVISGVIGQFLSVLPVVVIAVVLASVAECFLILPGHLTHGLSRAARWSWARLIAIAGISGLLSVFVLVRADIFVAAQGSALDAIRSLRAAAGGAAFDVVVMLACFILAAFVEFFIWQRRRRTALVGRTVNRGFRFHFDRLFNGFRDGPFAAFVRAAVSWRYLTLALMIGTMILAAGLMRGGRVGFVFFGSPEAETIRANVYFNAGISRAEASAAIERIGNALREAEAGLVAGSDEQLVLSEFAMLGQAGRSRGDNLAQYRARLSPSELRSIRTPQIVQAWRRAIPPMAGIARIAVFGERGGPPGRDIDVRLQGADTQTLKAASLDLQEALSAFPGVTGISDDLPWGKPELILSLSERGKILGFTLEDAARQIRNALEGVVALRFALGEEEITIRVSEARGAAPGAQLRRLELRSPQGNFLPVGEVVTFTERQGFSVIQHRDGRATVSVTGDVDNDQTSSADILADLEAGVLPDLAARFGIGHVLSGRAEERREAFADLGVGALAALLSMYIILAATFRSYGKPFVVLSIIPFGIVGSVTGHYIMDYDMTIMSMIGLLGLAGILVNNSIILVARLEERVAGGEGIRQAASGAAQDRLRAVILTSLTTIGGLLPLVFETSLQAQFLIPMAITIVFGLASATVLVLVLVPVLMTIGEDIRRMIVLQHTVTPPGGEAGRLEAGRTPAISSREPEADLNTS